MPFSLRARLFRPALSTPHDFTSLANAARRIADAQAHTLARQIAIAEIAAPTGDESRRGAALQAWLSTIGAAQGDVQVRVDAVGNVIARITRGAVDDPARAPVVVLAHMDTVCPDTTLPPTRHEGSRVVLPGIGDNSRGLAALLVLARVLGDTEVLPLDARPIELVATVGEEGVGNLRGATYYFDQRDASALPAPSAVIALDGPGDALVVHHAIASRRLRVHITGPGGHPWADPHARNAVHAMGHAISAIAQCAAAQRSGVTIAVTRMGGGESLTAVPVHAWCELDLRALDPTRIATITETVRQLVERACTSICARTDGERRGRDSAGSSALTTRYELLGDRPGGRLDAAHPLVALADAATRWHGRDPQSASASTDANVPLSRGIPAISIGAGGTGGAAHTDHEWYDDTDSARGIARALSIVVGAARGSSMG